MDIAHIPSRILIESKALNHISDFCKDLKNPLIISDPTTYDIAGKIVEKELNVQVEIVRDVKGFDFKKTSKAGYIIAVGGGKILDAGKLAAFKADVPFIAIPTAPSHDGIFSPTVTLKELGIQSFKAKPAFGVLADLDILAKAPKRMISAGAADAVSKYSSVWDWKEAAKIDPKEQYSDFTANLALLAFEIIRKNAVEIKKASHSGVKALIEALFSSGLAMCLAGSSRPASGSEHAFGHALDSLGANIMHGEAVGLGTIISSYIQKRDWRLVKTILNQIGAPTTAKQAGLDRNLVIKALVQAKTIRPRWTVLNTINLNEKIAEEICLKTGVF